MVQTKLSSQLKKVEKQIDAVKQQFLINMANEVVNITITPNEMGKVAVDTGAYIESHSIRTTRGAGRARSSSGKAPNQNPETKAAEALDLLMQDISALPKDATQIYLSNNSPHASLVEFSYGYNVYGTLRGRAKYLLEDAKNKVRGTQ